MCSHWRRVSRDFSPRELAAGIQNLSSNGGQLVEAA